MAKACLNSEGGAEREKGLAVGTLSLRGPLNPICPLLPGPQSAGAGSWELRDFNEGLAAALGLWWACVACRLLSVDLESKGGVIKVLKMSNNNNNQEENEKEEKEEYTEEKGEEIMVKIPPPPTEVNGKGPEGKPVPKPLPNGHHCQPMNRSIFPLSAVSPAAERIRFILGEEDDGPAPPQLFTELDELLSVDGQEMEWKETAR